MGNYSIESLINRGAVIPDPQGIIVDESAEIEEGVKLAPYCVIGSGVRVRRGAEILSFSVIEESDIGEGSVIGPSARLRGGNVIGEGCRIGNYVEVKHSFIGARVKAAHLTYIGDAYIGEGCNIGCGVVFCNYDGKSKRATYVGCNTFIGSNCNLIAPISVGANCFVAAGTTLGRDLPDCTFCKAERELTIRPNRPR